MSVGRLRTVVIILSVVTCDSSSIKQIDTISTTTTEKAVVVSDIELNIHPQHQQNNRRKKSPI